MTDTSRPLALVIGASRGLGFALAEALADTHQLHRIAFPAISTGNYGFPIEQAAKIAVDSVSASPVAR